MKNKKKQRKRYTQEPRLDFRQGGRVPFNAGQAARRAKEAADAQEAEDQAAAQAEAAARATQEEKEKTPPSVDPDERREGIARTTETVEASARGEVPPEAVIPPAQQVDEGIKADVKQLSDSDLVKATAGTATATQQAVTQAGPSQRAEVPDDVPPVSKVMPFPTITSGCSVFLPPLYSIIMNLDSCTLPFPTDKRQCIPSFSISFSPRTFTDRFLYFLPSSLAVFPR